MKHITESTLTPDQYNKLSKEDLDINVIPNIVRDLLNKVKEPNNIQHCCFHDSRYYLMKWNKETKVDEPLSELDDDHIRALRNNYASACKDAYNIQNTHLSFEYIKFYYDIKDDGFDDIRSKGIVLKRDFNH